MNALSKLVWTIAAVILFVGTNIFYFIAIDAVVYLLVLWLKPEWLKDF